jgi:dihydrofolate synthase / folylpolyglutamate synthase
MKDGILSPAEAFAWIESFTNLERGTVPFDGSSYHLDRMRRLLAMFGSPETGIPLIHVAGTKGKGSTAALLASVLRASGRKTGLYTSPHVADPFERIVLAGEAARPGALVRIVRAMRDAVESVPAEGPAGFPPTTFELYTLLAFLYFRDAGCDVAVIETGIGGRLDATNVITPEASVITPLDLEHTDVLGDTMEKIAAEKAGIIKPGVPAFVGLQPAAALDVFRAAARERGAALTLLEEETRRRDVRLSASGTELHLELRDGTSADFRLSMLGEFQAENAALAYLTLRGVHPEITPGQFRRGFRAARLPGRMELVRGRPPVVLDGAHTPLAVHRLLESFRGIFPRPLGPRAAVLLFGSVAGKNPRAMAEILAPWFQSVVVSTPGTFKQSDPEGVWRIFRELNPAAELVKDPADALRRARQLAGSRLPILVTGSFYMVSEIRRLL